MNNYMVNVNNSSPAYKSVLLHSSQQAEGQQSDAFFSARRGHRKPKGGIECTTIKLADDTKLGGGPLAEGDREV